MGLVYAYLDTLDVDEDERRRIEEYLDLIKRRTNGAYLVLLAAVVVEARRILGSLKTAATWIREFVRSHPAYKYDSVISQEINYDLLTAVDEM